MNKISDSKANKIERKGIHKFLRIHRSYSYIFIGIAVVFGILGFIDLLDSSTYILNRTSAFELMMLCAIFGLLLRFYYKTFEEPYKG